jgi:hypothetical protein
MGYLEAIARLKETKESMVPKKPWLAAWRELATLTYGINAQDPRLGPALTALNSCDKAFASDDWARFQRGANDVKEIVGLKCQDHQAHNQKE